MHSNTSHSDRFSVWLEHAQCNGDMVALRAVVLAAEVHGDRLELAFTVRDRAALGQWLEASHPALPGQVQICPSATALAQAAENAVFLSRLMPQGAARVTVACWEAMLLAGLIESFSLSPLTHPDSSSPTHHWTAVPSAVSAEVREALREAGIVSALDLCAKLKLTDGTRHLQESSGLGVPEIEEALHACEDALDDEEREWLLRNAPLPRATGFLPEAGAGFHGDGPLPEATARADEETPEKGEE